MTKYSVAYLRVSNEEQIDNFSLENQKDYCINESQKRDSELLEIFREEGKSATTTNRPQLLSLLNYCSKNKDRVSTVFVYRFDRLSRDAYQALGTVQSLSEMGIEVVSCTEPSGNDPMGNFMQVLSFGLAQLDNDIKSQRTLDGMKKRFQSGLPHGKAPLGYLNSINDLNRPIIIKDIEQFDLVKQSWEEYAKGVHTFESIATFMNTLGLKIKIGKRRKLVTSQHAHRIFNNKFYMGIITSERWGESKGIHQQMIPEELFYKVQAILKGKSHKMSPHKRRNPEFPIRNLVKCGRCGNPLTAGWSTGRAKKYAYYYCNSGKHKSPSVPKEIFHYEFVSYLKQLTPKKAFTKKFSKIIEEKYESKVSRYRLQYSIANKELIKLETKRQRVIDAHIRGTFNESVFNEQLDLITNEIEVKKVVIADSQIDQLDIRTFLSLLESFITNLAKAYARGSLEQKQVIFGSIFPEKVYYDFPDFRTARLAPFLEPFKGLEDPQELLGVVDGDRTRSLLLHKQPLYH